MNNRLLKSTLNLPLALLLVVSLAVGCSEEYVTYSDGEYVMFADTLSTNIVEMDKECFTIKVASTVKRDYDRTFGVEVLDKGSNAIEGLHYVLPQNSVTIPAGKLSGEIKVEGKYENIEPTDSLGFTLKLVMAQELKWKLYENSDQVKVVMYKSCPFDINNFTGWCVFSSLFLRDYPGENTSYSRLVYTEPHPSEKDMIIVRNCFFDGYDITVRFHGDDAANPLITMDEDQIVSNEESVFGQILGDNKILCDESQYYPSYFNSCQRFAALWTHIYVENVGEVVGTVGNYYNVFEWISDEEADRIRREGF